MRAAADFTETTRRGTKVPSGSVVVYLLATGSPDPARMGVVTGKNVGGSVERHRAARRIRAAVAAAVAELPPGSRLVVRALRGADTDPALARHVQAGVERARARAGVA